jgi:hemerythrin
MLGHRAIANVYNIFAFKHIIAFVSRGRDCYKIHIRSRAMGSYFQWKDDYETGDQTVDDQHQYLFKLANRLQITGPSECKPIIMDLYQYTRVHFKAEEEIMEEFKYPSLKQHKKLHSNLISSLNNLSENYSESETERDDLIAIFGNWIINHILNEDLRFANYVASLEG